MEVSKGFFLAPFEENEINCDVLGQASIFRDDGHLYEVEAQTVEYIQAALEFP